MIEELDYAEGTMEGAALLEVYDSEGRRIWNCVEANAREGWRRQIVMAGGRRMRGADGKDLIERIQGPVKILKRAPNPEVAQTKIERAAAKRARRAARLAKTAA